MNKKVNQKAPNQHDILRQLAGATHSEVQYFLPYLTAWLPDKDDPMLADMNSICASLLLYSLEGQLFAPDSTVYKN